MKKRGPFLLFLVILTILLVMGCGAANKTSGLPDSSALLGNSEHSQIDETTVAEQNSEDSTQKIADDVKSTQAKIPSQVDTANSTSVPPKNTLPPSGTSVADKVSATEQPSVSVSQQPATVPPPAKNSVTIAINCQTAVDKGMDKEEKFQGVVPPDGVILPVTRVEISDGETVFSVLKRVTREHRVQMDFKGSQGSYYIRGINNLYELDGGPLSGWMYIVNNLNPSYSCGEYKLKNGDAIEWKYTSNMGKDL